MSKIKNGKLPMSAKPIQRPLSADDAFGGSTQSLPADVKADMEKRKLVPRWLNAQEVAKNQGYHPKGWQIYKRPEGMSVDYQFGSDPTGVVRRGDCILGFKPATGEGASHEKHLAFLRQRAGAQSDMVALARKQMGELQDIAGKMTEVQDFSDEDED